MAERPRRRREDDNDDERRPSRPARSGKKPPARRGRDDRGRDNRGRKAGRSRPSRDGERRAPAERRGDGRTNRPLKGTGKRPVKVTGKRTAKRRRIRATRRRGSAPTTGATKTEPDPQRDPVPLPQDPAGPRANPSRSRDRRPDARCCARSRARRPRRRGRPGPGRRPRAGRRRCPAAGAAGTEAGDELARIAGRNASRPGRPRGAAEAYASGRERDAARILRPLRDAYPDAAAVRELLGLVHYRLGQYPAALRELTAFVDLTGSVEQHPVLMDSWRAQRHYDKVEELWEELAQSSPSGALVTEGRIVLAGAQADNGRVQEAIQTLARRPTT